jgi:hypothetical protein
MNRITLTMSSGGFALALLSILAIGALGAGCQPNRGETRNCTRHMRDLYVDPQSYGSNRKLTGA